MSKVIFWFRQDLRCYDNIGLIEAARVGQVLPIYIYDEGAEIGEASRWWLHNSLYKLNEKLGGKLNFYKGSAKDIILRLTREKQIDAVYWSRCYEPQRIKQDADIKGLLTHMGVACETFNSSLLREPWEVKKPDGSAYKLFTPYWQKGYLQAVMPSSPKAAPTNLSLLVDANSVKLEVLGLLPAMPWYDKLRKYWQCGEGAAQERLKDFLENGLSGYKEGRNFPAKHHVSRLSPYLHFGEISINQVWHAVQAKRIDNMLSEADINAFLMELVWREFSYYMLYNFPELPHKNFQIKFDKFEWQTDIEALRAWQKGKTGYPIIDAAMRELWETGYMHNRMRMIVGSFLVKNLLLNWHHGAEWFWDCLLDADLASNSFNWQWVAGSGTDAAPYFRIFNPVLQGEKFDPDGSYTRKFVPELRKLPNAYLFKPWEAKAHILKEAGIVLGENYPLPIIDLSYSRQRALTVYGNLL